MNIFGFSLRLIAACALLILLGWALAVTAFLLFVAIRPGEGGDFVSNSFLAAIYPAGIALVCAFVIWKARHWLFPSPH